MGVRYSAPSGGDDEEEDVIRIPLDVAVRAAVLIQNRARILAARRRVRNFRAFVLAERQRRELEREEREARLRREREVANEKALKYIEELKAAQLAAALKAAQEAAEAEAAAIAARPPDPYMRADGKPKTRFDYSTSIGASVSADHDSSSGSGPHMLHPEVMMRYPSINLIRRSYEADVIRSVNDQRHIGVLSGKDPAVDVSVPSAVGEEMEEQKEASLTGSHDEKKGNTKANIGNEFPDQHPKQQAVSPRFPSWRLKSDSSRTIFPIATSPRGNSTRRDAPPLSSADKAQSYYLPSTTSPPFLVEQNDRAISANGADLFRNMDLRVAIGEARETTEDEKSRDDGTGTEPDRDTFEPIQNIVQKNAERSPRSMRQKRGSGGSSPIFSQNRLKQEAFYAFPLSQAQSTMANEDDDAGDRDPMYTNILANSTSTSVIGRVEEQRTMLDGGKPILSRGNNVYPRSKHHCIMQQGAYFHPSPISARYESELYGSFYGKTDYPAQAQRWNLPRGRLIHPLVGFVIKTRLSFQGEPRNVNGDVALADTGELPAASDPAQPRQACDGGQKVREAVREGRRVFINLCHHPAVSDIASTVPRALYAFDFFSPSPLADEEGQRGEQQQQQEELDSRAIGTANTRKAPFPVSFDSVDDQDPMRYSRSLSHSADSVAGGVRVSNGRSPRHHHSLHRQSKKSIYAHENGAIPIIFDVVIPTTEFYEHFKYQDSIGIVPRYAEAKGNIALYAVQYINAQNIHARVLKKSRIGSPLFQIIFDELRECKLNENKISIPKVQRCYIGDITPLTLDMSPKTGLERVHFPMQLRSNNVPSVSSWSVVDEAVNENEDAITGLKRKGRDERDGARGSVRVNLKQEERDKKDEQAASKVRLSRKDSDGSVKNTEAREEAKKKGVLAGFLISPPSVFNPRYPILSKGPLPSAPGSDATGRPISGLGGRSAGNKSPQLKRIGDKSAPLQNKETRGISPAVLTRASSTDSINSTASNINAHLLPPNWMKSPHFSSEIGLPPTIQGWVALGNSLTTTEYAPPVPAALMPSSAGETETEAQYELSAKGDLLHALSALDVAEGTKVDQYADQHGHLLLSSSSPMHIKHQHQQQQHQQNLLLEKTQLSQIGRLNTLPPPHLRGHGYESGDGAMSAARAAPSAPQFMAREERYDRGMGEDAEVDADVRKRIGLQGALFGDVSNIIEHKAREGEEVEEEGEASHVDESGHLLNLSPEHSIELSSEFYPYPYPAGILPSSTERASGVSAAETDHHANANAIPYPAQLPESRLQECVISSVEVYAVVSCGMLILYRVAAPLPPTAVATAATAPTYQIQAEQEDGFIPFTAHAHGGKTSSATNSSSAGSSSRCVEVARVLLSSHAISFDLNAARNRYVIHLTPIFAHDINSDINIYRGEEKHKRENVLERGEEKGRGDREGQSSGSQQKTTDSAAQLSSEGQTIDGETARTLDLYVSERVIANAVVQMKLRKIRQERREREQERKRRKRAREAKEEERRRSAAAAALRKERGEIDAWEGRDDDREEEEEEEEEEEDVEEGPEYDSEVDDYDEIDPDDIPAVADGTQENSAASSGGASGTGALLGREGQESESGSGERLLPTEMVTATAAAKKEEALDASSVGILRDQMSLFLQRANVSSYFGSSSGTEVLVDSASLGIGGKDRINDYNPFQPDITNSLKSVDNIPHSQQTMRNMMGDEIDGTAYDKAAAPMTVVAKKKKNRLTLRFRSFSELLTWRIYLSDHANFARNRVHDVLSSLSCSPASREDGSPSAGNTQRQAETKTETHGAHARERLMMRQLTARSMLEILPQGHLLTRRLRRILLPQVYHRTGAMPAVSSTVQDPFPVTAAEAAPLMAGLNGAERAAAAIAGGAAAQRTVVVRAAAGAEDESSRKSLRDQQSPLPRAIAPPARIASEERRQTKFHGCVSVFVSGLPSQMPSLPLNQADISEGVEDGKDLNVLSMLTRNAFIEIDPKASTEATTTASRTGGSAVRERSGEDTDGSIPSIGRVNEAVAAVKARTEEVYVEIKNGMLKIFNFNALPDRLDDEDAVTDVNSSSPLPPGSSVSRSLSRSEGAAAASAVDTRTSTSIGVNRGTDSVVSVGGRVGVVVDTQSAGADSLRRNSALASGKRRASLTRSDDAPADSKDGGVGSDDYDYDDAIDWWRISPRAAAVIPLSECAVRIRFYRHRSSPSLEKKMAVVGVPPAIDAPAASAADGDDEAFQAAATRGEVGPETESFTGTELDAERGRFAEYSAVPGSVLEVEYDQLADAKLRMLGLSASGNGGEDDDDEEDSVDFELDAILSHAQANGEINVADLQRIEEAKAAGEESTGADVLVNYAESPSYREAGVGNEDMLPTGQREASAGKAPVVAVKPQIARVSIYKLGASAETEYGVVGTNDARESQEAPIVDILFFASDADLISPEFGVDPMSDVFKSADSASHRLEREEERKGAGEEGRIGVAGDPEAVVENAQAPSKSNLPKNVRKSSLFKDGKGTKDEHRSATMLSVDKNASFFASVVEANVAAANAVTMLYCLSLLEHCLGAVSASIPSLNRSSSSFSDFSAVVPASPTVGDRDILASAHGSLPALHSKDEQKTPKTEQNAESLMEKSAQGAFAVSDFCSLMSLRMLSPAVAQQELSQKHTTYPLLLLHPSSISDPNPSSVSPPASASSLFPTSESMSSSFRVTFMPTGADTPSAACVQQIKQLLAREPTFSSSTFLDRIRGRPCAPLDGKLRSIGVGSSDVDAHNHTADRELNAKGTLSAKNKGGIFGSSDTNEDRNAPESIRDTDGGQQLLLGGSVVLSAQQTDASATMARMTESLLSTLSLLPISKSMLRFAKPQRAALSIDVAAVGAEVGVSVGGEVGLGTAEIMKGHMERDKETVLLVNLGDFVYVIHATNFIVIAAFDLDLVTEITSRIPAHFVDSKHGVDSGRDDTGGHLEGWIDGDRDLDGEGSVISQLSYGGVSTIVGLGMRDDIENENENDIESRPTNDIGSVTGGLSGVDALESIVESNDEHGTEHDAPLTHAPLLLPLSHPLPEQAPSSNSTSLEGSSARQRQRMENEKEKERDQSRRVHADSTVDSEIGSDRRDGGVGRDVRSSGHFGRCTIRLLSDTNQCFELTPTSYTDYQNWTKLLRRTDDLCRGIWKAKMRAEKEERQKQRASRLYDLFVAGQLRKSNDADEDVNGIDEENVISTEEPQNNESSANSDIDAGEAARAGGSNTSVLSSRSKDGSQKRKSTNLSVATSASISTTTTTAAVAAGATALGGKGVGGKSDRKGKLSPTAISRSDVGRNENKHKAKSASASMSKTEDKTASSAAGRGGRDVSSSVRADRRAGADEDSSSGRRSTTSLKGGSGSSNVGSGIASAKSRRMSTISGGGGSGSGSVRKTVFLPTKPSSITGSDSSIGPSGVTGAVSRRRESTIAAGSPRRAIGTAGPRAPPVGLEKADTPTSSRQRSGTTVQQPNASSSASASASALPSAPISGGGMGSSNSSNHYNSSSNNNDNNSTDARLSGARLNTSSSMPTAVAAPSNTASGSNPNSSDNNSNNSNSIIGIGRGGGGGDSRLGKAGIGPTGGQPPGPLELTDGTLKASQPQSPKPSRTSFASQTAHRQTARNR